MGSHSILDYYYSNSDIEANRLFNFVFYFHCAGLTIGPVVKAYFQKKNFHSSWVTRLSGTPTPRSMARALASGEYTDSKSCVTSSVSVQK